MYEFLSEFLTMYFVLLLGVIILGTENTLLSLLTPFRNSKMDVKCADRLGGDLTLVDTLVFGLHIRNVQLVFVGTGPVHHPVPIVTRILELAHRQNVQFFVFQPGQLEKVAE